MGAIPATARRDREAPTVWMVRAGEGGVHAPVFVQEGAVFLGWGAAGDISGLSLEAVTGRVADAWPEYNRRQRGQAANALYKFAVDMQPGDVVVTPEPASRTVLLGEISGDYHHLPSPVVADYSHARPVTWRARISRDELSYGAKNSLSTQITLSQPPHVAEFLRLFEAHAADGEVSALPQRSRPATPRAGRRAGADSGERRRAAARRRGGVPHRPPHDAPDARRTRLRPAGAARLPAHASSGHPMRRGSCSSP